VSRLAVNVDVDSLDLYYAIHGLSSGAATDAAWTVGIPRFLELFAQHGLKATFFVVAADLEREGPRTVAAQCVAEGHELASHTYSHPYDLIHLSAEAIAGEIIAAEAPLQALRGTPIVGFRAPGYNISKQVLALLADRGYRYDSSLFPCPAYYAARASVIGLMRLRNRRSRSIVGDLRAPFGRLAPHRLDSGMLEYPMTVVPGIRFPLIGTSLTLLGERGVRSLAPVISRMDFVNLEFHAVDLLDASDLPDDQALVAVQGDLRRPVAAKRRAFSAAFAACGRADNATLEVFSQVESVLRI
jgi:hypothetical protein